MLRGSARWLFGLVAMAVFSASFGAVSAQDPTLQRRYDRIEQEASQLRNLPILEDIEVTFKTSDEFRQEFEGDLATDYPAEDRARDERILKAFGLAPEETDLSALYVNLYSEQVAGYYDPETSEMVVIRPADAGNELTPSQEITYAHEVIHALQDQNFSLDEALETSGEANDDQSLAVTALIEGDATAAQTEYLTSKPGLFLRLTAEFVTAEFSTEQLDAAPPIIRETLLFPYQEGAEFVAALRDEGDWARVDEAHANPPVSSEQILHPEKYLSGERPAPVDVPDLTSTLGPGWAEIDDNAFGEFAIGVLLDGQPASAEQADAAALGWSGDRYRVWTSGDQTAIVWRSTWESSGDTNEFAEALARYEEQRRASERQEGPSGGIRVVAEGAVSDVLIDGENVTYILSPDESTADTLVGALGQ